MGLLKRGVIRNRDLAAQTKDFSGLLYGNRTPTDLDGLIELNGAVTVFIEGKGRGAPMKDGQRIALERLADDVGRLKPTLLLVVEPWRRTKEGWCYASAWVRRCRVQRAWHDVHVNTIACRAMIDEFVAHVTPNELASASVCAVRRWSRDGRLGLEAGVVRVHTDDPELRATIAEINPAVLQWAIRSLTNVSEATQAGLDAFCASLPRRAASSCAKTAAPNTSGGGRG